MIEHFDIFLHMISMDFWIPVIFLSFFGSIVRFLVLTKEPKTLRILIAECIVGMFVAVMFSIGCLEYEIARKLIDLGAGVSGMLGLELLQIFKNFLFGVIKKKVNGITGTTTITTTAETKTEQEVKDKL